MAASTLLEARLNNKSAIILLYPFILQDLPVSEAKKLITAAEIRRRRDKQNLPLWKSMDTGTYEGVGVTDAIARALQKGRWYRWKLAEDAVNLLGNGPKYFWQVSKEEIPLPVQNMYLLLSGKGIGFLSLYLPMRGVFLHHAMEILRSLRRMNTEIALRRVQKNSMEPFPIADWGIPFPASVQEQAKMSIETWVYAFLQHSLGGQQNWTSLHDPQYLIPYGWLIIDKEYSSPTGTGKNELAGILYCLRHFFSPRSGEAGSIHSGNYELNIESRNQLLYSPRSWFISSMEGCVFFSDDPNDFIQNQLPSHLENVYFFAYQFVLMQRFYLLHFSQQHILTWLERDGSEEETSHDRRGVSLRRFTDWMGLESARKIEIFRHRMEDFLEFITLYYPPQVFLGERHHKAYLFWQETLEVPRLYERVQYQLRLLYEHSENEESRRIENRLNLLGVLIGVPSLIFAVLSINIVGFTADEGLKPSAAVAWVLGAFISAGFLAIYLLRRRLYWRFRIGDGRIKSPLHDKWRRMSV